MSGNRWHTFATTDELFAQLEAEARSWQSPTSSGCTLPADVDCTTMGMASATVLPRLPAMRFVKAMLVSNQNFLKHFRNWLHMGGFVLAGRLVYGHAARIALSLLDKDWRDIDCVNGSTDGSADMMRVRDYIACECAGWPDERVTQHLLKGLTRFAEYLALRHPRQQACVSNGKLAHVAWPQATYREPQWADFLCKRNPATGKGIAATNPFDDMGIADNRPDDESDDPSSGCIVPAALKHRRYTKSNILPRTLRNELRPAGLRLVPVKQWTQANQAFYQHFRNWLHASGYSPSALYLYGLSVRVAFSLLVYEGVIERACEGACEGADTKMDAGVHKMQKDWQKDWRDVDPQADLMQVRAWIDQHYTGAGTRLTYYKGLDKLAQYLRRRQARQLDRMHPLKRANCAVRGDETTHRLPMDATRSMSISASIDGSLVDYFACCKRNWPPDRIDEIASDWWAHITLPLRKMRVLNLVVDQPSDLTPALWYAYVDARLSQGISACTLNGELSALKGWLFWLDESGGDADTTMRVDARMLRLRALREPTRVPKDIPPGELLTLQRVIERESLSPDKHVRWRGVMDFAWFLLMLHCGLRTGEIRRLRHADIDWERRHIRIEASKHLRSRVVPMSLPATDALNAWVTLRGDDAGDDVAAQSGLPATVFFDRHQALSQSYCYSRLQTYGSRCGVQCSPHQLRHSCATLLLNAGMPVQHVQAVLGHVSIETTRGYARSYDGTVAADYTRAMLSVERDLGIGNEALVITPDQVIAMLDSLKTLGTLNAQQLDALAMARAGVVGLTQPNDLA